MPEEVEFNEKKPMIVETREEKTSQAIGDGVSSDLEMPVFSTQQDIYAKFDKKNRNFTPEEEPTPGEETPPTAVEEPEVVPEVPVEELEDEVPTPKVEEPETVTLKVYGREIEVDKAKVEANGGKKEYQKILAANEKAQIERDRIALEDEKKKLEAERLELERQKTQIPPPGESKKNNDLPSDDHEDKDLVTLAEKAGENLIDGDVEAFAKTISSALKQPKIETAEPVDIDKLTREVETRTTNNMVQKQRREQVRLAQENFSVEYPELVADPVLFNKVDRRTILLQEENPNKTPLEILRLAADEVTTLYAPKPETPVESEEEKAIRLAKVAEKRTMNTPRGGTKRTQRPPTPQKATKSDYIEELKRSRGQI